MDNLKFNKKEIENRLEHRVIKYYIQEFFKFLIVAIILIGIYIILVYLLFDKKINLNIFVSTNTIVVYISILAIYTQFYPALKNLKINSKYLYMAILEKLTTIGNNVDEFKNIFVQFSEKTENFQKDTMTYRTNLFKEMKEYRKETKEFRKETINFRKNDLEETIKFRKETIKFRKETIKFQENFQNQFGEFLKYLETKDNDILLKLIKDNDNEIQLNRKKNIENQQKISTFFQQNETIVKMVNDVHCGPSTIDSFANRILSSNDSDYAINIDIDKKREKI